jgi:hypothetical protein
MHSANIPDTQISMARGCGRMIDNSETNQPDHFRLARGFKLIRRRKVGGRASSAAKRGSGLLTQME